MKVTLFDLDGTLVSTGGAGMRALDRVFASLHKVENAMAGITPSGKTDPRIVREIFESKLGRAPRRGEVEAALAGYLGYLADELKNGHPYKVLDGVKPLLARLAGRRDVALGLGTGNMERGARLKLEPGGLNGYFAFGGFGSDSEIRPELLAAGVRKAEAAFGRSVAPRDVFIIGDTVLDVAAGKAIGAVTVAVSWGEEDDILAAAEPDLLLSSLAEPDAFLSLLS